MVGARGFEPPTPASRTRCATGLRYAPISGLNLQPPSDERLPSHAVRLGDSLAGNFPVDEVHALCEGRISANGARHTG